MKKDIFNDYVDRVCHIFGLEKETLFTKNKRKDVVDARFLLYYLCRDRKSVV
jgi:chromosomal replication initiation ATPase DnaA